MVRYLRMLVVAVFLFFLTACAQERHFIESPHYLHLNSTSFRADHPEVFRPEYRLINRRLPATLAATGAERPNTLVGMAFSGGGIRSNAFQLGLMSALIDSDASGWGVPNHAPSDTCRHAYANSLLSRVAYLSTVSGGTWAAAALRAHKCPVCLFDNLELVIRTEGQCDTLADEDVSRCEEAKRVLNNSYEDAAPYIARSNRVTDLFNIHSDYTAREAWRKLLLAKHIGAGNDVPMLQLETGTDKPPMGPFLIINTTHDATRATDPKHNFPFEITGLGMGTIADNGNTQGYSVSPLVDATGAFVTYDHSAPLWTCPINLSHAIAMSGDVFPSRWGSFKFNLFEWYLPFPTAGSRRLERSPRELRNSTGALLWMEQRAEYVLTDGGQSENLGALGLMERGVDLLIISDAGYDPTYTFGDYDALKHHARHLLGRGIFFATNGTFTDDMEDHLRQGRLDITRNELHDHVHHAYENREFKPTSDEAFFRREDLAEHSSLFEGRYFPLTDGTPSGALKQVFYLKPSMNITPFLRHLERHPEYRGVYQYLSLNKTSFPYTKTFAISYDQTLIYAYYLYGRYLGQTSIAPILERLIPSQNDARVGGP